MMTLDGTDHAADHAARNRQGVDVTLIDEMLLLTPGERLQLNDRAVSAVQELRRAFAASR